MAHHEEDGVQDVGSAPAEVQLRLVTFNVHAWQDRHRRCNTRRVADLLRQLQPHLICLQVRVL